MSITRSRIEFENHFVQIPNTWMRDQRLTRRARGLLAEIMTHEVGWNLTSQILASNGPEGRDAIRSALQELEKCGYLERVQARSGGKFEAVDYVLKDPFRTMDPPMPENPAPVKPAPVDPSLKNNSFKEDHREEHKGGLASPVNSPARAEASDSPDAWSDLGGAVSDVPPPRLLLDPERCEFHQHSINPGPCQGCRKARAAHEEHQRQLYRESVLAERQRQLAAHQARLAAIAGCGICNDEGYANGVPCHHDPDHNDRLKRGAALVRQALSEIK